MTLEPMYVNGPECDPVCYVGKVDFSSAFR